MDTTTWHDQRPTHKPLSDAVIAAKRKLDAARAAKAAYEAETYDQGIKPDQTRMALLRHYEWLAEFNLAHLDGDRATAEIREEGRANVLSLKAQV